MTLVFEVARRTFIVLMLVFFLMPLIWMVATSVKRPVEISTTTPVVIPVSPTLDNYRAALGLPIDQRDLSITVASRRAPRSFANSILVASVTTLMVIALASPAAYALARIRTRGRDSVGRNILFSRILPPAAIALPLFSQFTALRLTDTPFVLVALYVGATLPFAVWTLSTFIRDIPPDMEEAAFVDGATLGQALRYVVVPVLAPAVAAVAVITFSLAFNEFFMALIFTRVEWLTFPVQTASLVGTGGTPWGPITAAGVLGLIPPVVTLLVGRRYLVQGLSLGAVK